MMSKCWLVAVFAVALSITSTTAHAGGHVYALRGLINVFSYGMDEMVNKCKRRGIQASAHGHAEYHSLAAQAAVLVKRGKGPIIIVGHSYGADAAVFMAEEMRKLGAPVALLVLYGPTIDPLGIPSNVRSVVNYYQTNNPAWRGRAVPGPGFRGSINNINLDNATDVTHFNIEKVGRLQDQAMGRIAALTGTGRAIASDAPAVTSEPAPSAPVRASASTSRAAGAAKPAATSRRSAPHGSF
jgi:pimeloyl-ACP methyl ester carboxylesterase